MDKNEKKPLEEKAKRILTEIEQQRKEAKKRKMSFSAVTKEQLYKKLTKKGSPMIVSQSWGGAPSGGKINYSVGIHNPDPYTRGSLFCYVFFGPSNMVPDVGKALCTVDTRFPRLTLPNFGLFIDPDTTEYLTFEISIPIGIEASNYMGNCFLFRASYHDIGDYLDRGFFNVSVT